jgi:hypothetical protein
MTSILDRVAKSHLSEFRPLSVDDYFVLRLAKALGEPAAAPHYAVLASQHTQSILLCAYRKAMDTNPDHPAPAFHQILESLNGHGNRPLPRPRMMAIRIERRAVAMALFGGTQLEGWRVRQLPSDSMRAEDSCVGFVRTVLDEHHCEGAVFERISGDAARVKLHDLAVGECRALGISVMEISKQTVIESFAHPAPTSRHEIREIVSQMWLVPKLKGGRDFILDAAALGLYVQTERLLTSNS